MSRLELLHRRIAALGRRRLGQRWAIAWSAGVAGLLALLALAFAIDWVFQMSRVERAAALVVYFLAAVWGYLRYARPWLTQRESEAEIAMLLERRHRIDGDLVASLQFESARADSWGSPELRQAIVERAARRAPELDETPWESPPGLRQRIRWLAAVVAIWLLLIVAVPSHLEVFFRRLILDVKHYPARTRFVAIAVNGRAVDPKMRRPARMAVRHHAPVVFEVTCAGAIPREGRIHVIGTDGTRTTLAAVAIEDQPDRFRAELPQAYEPIYYQLFFGDAWTDPAPLGITVPPTIDVEVEVTPPAYAARRGRQPERLPANLRQIAVLEGSRMRLAIRSDKPLAGAVFAAGDKPPEPLVAADGSARQWTLPDKGTLETVVEPIAYTIQVTDAQGGHLDAPWTGTIRVEPDALPEVAAGAATRLVLPEAKPVIHYRARDDYGLAGIAALCEVLRADGTVSEDETAIDRIEKGQPPRPEVEGDYPLALAGRKLAKGDRLRLTFRAVDDRAPRDGKAAQCEPIVFEVTDPSGILTAMTETNRRSAEILDTMIRRQIRLGEQAAPERSIQEEVLGQGRQLIASGLDVPLRQLAENGLGEEDFAKDLRWIRDHLDAVLEHDMPELIALISRRESAPASDRERLRKEARRKGREVLVRLVVVRESLLRRLKSIEIAAEAARLAAIERKALAATQSLPGQAAVRRESAHLAALDDQRDAGALGRRFQAGLREASRWTGPLGEEARQALEDLKRVEFDKKLALAEKRLEQGLFTEAAQSQKEILEALGRLMERLPAQAKERVPDATLSSRIQEALERQQAIRDETRRENLDTAASDRLAQQQIDLRKEIATLAEQAGEVAVQEGSAARQAMERARQAAAEAAAGLFEQDQALALRKQEEVLASLTQAAESLASAPAKEPFKRPAKTAMSTEDLERTTGALESLEKEQQALTAEVPGSDQAAMAQFQQREAGVAKRLAELSPSKTIPEPVARRIRQAEASAALAAQAMERRDPLAAERARSAGQAIQRAVSEAKTTLADRQRRSLSRRLEEQGPLSEANRTQELAQQFERVRRQQLDATQQLREAVEKNLAGALCSPAQALGSVARAQERTARAIEAQDRAANAAARNAEHAAPGPKGHVQDAAAKADEEAAQAAREAAAQAQGAAPEAAVTLEKAAAASLRARKLAASGENSEAADARLAAGQSLRRAVTQLEQVQRDLRGQMARQAGKQAPVLKELVPRAVPVDAAATAALQEALRQAQRAGDASPGSKDAGSPQAGQAVQSALSQAAASLTRRADQLAAEGTPPRQAAPDATKRPSPSSPPAQGAQTSGAAASAGVSLRDVLVQDAWFAMLPAEMRAAIRSHSQRRPPRGYEERMQKYFSDKTNE